MQPRNIDVLDVLAPKPEETEFLGPGRSPSAQAIHPWWRAWKYIISIFALVIIVIAIVGGVVGSSLHQNTTGTGSPLNSDTVSSSNPFPSPSAAPVLWTIRGNKRSDNSVAGFVANLVGLSQFGLTLNSTRYLKVTLDGLSSPFNIIMTNGPDPKYNHLGLVIGFRSGNLSVSATDFLVISGTGRTATNSTPSKAGNSYDITANCESAVWSLPSSASQELIVQWVNPDGSRPNGIFWYLPNLDQLLLLGNRATQLIMGYEGYEVTFTLVLV